LVFFRNIAVVGHGEEIVLSEFSSIAKEVKAHKLEFSKEVTSPISPGPKPNKDLKEAVKYPQISASTVQETMMKPKNSEQSILGRENFKDFDQIFDQLDINDSESSAESNNDNLSDVVAEPNLVSNNLTSKSDSSSKEVSFNDGSFESKNAASSNVKTEERSYSDKKLIPIQTTFKPRKKKGVEL
jgi:hypothetical protein